jgi:putative Holliday junction resolvase
MTAPAARTVLSFDYGLRRIGVAVGNTLTGTAEALATVAADDGLPDWRAVDRLVTDWRPAAIVAGVPYNMAGRDAARLTTAALRFADELGSRYGIEVHRVDERLTSREAEDDLRERRRSGAKTKRVRRGDVDREAARLLLLQWLRGLPGPRAT